MYRAPFSDGHSAPERHALTTWSSSIDRALDERIGTLVTPGRGAPGDTDGHGAGRVAGCAHPQMHPKRLPLPVESQAMASRRCSECGKSIAQVARERAAAGLPRFSDQVKTCSQRCSRERQRRWSKAWWAKIRKRTMEVRPASEPWRCSECGIDLAGADRKRKRLGLRPIRLSSVVCSPRCAKARELRRYIVRYGRVPRQS